MYEKTERMVRKNVIGERKTVVEGVPISYKIYRPLTRPGYFDSFKQKLKLLGKKFAGHFFHRRKMYRAFESCLHPNAEWCWVDSEGNIYVCELPGVRKDLRKKFMDVIAYHEKLEFEWLKKRGLPAPKWKIISEDELEIAEEIHHKAHYHELLAARNMGILKEYAAWRPKEYVTGEFLKRLATEAPQR